MEEGEEGTIQGSHSFGHPKSIGYMGRGRTSAKLQPKSAGDTYVVGSGSCKRLQSFSEKYVKLFLKIC